MPAFEIVHTELLEWLREYEGPRFHAILSDPPYALISIAKRFGKAGQAPAQEGTDGRFSRLSGGFMGQRWDSFQSYEHYRKWITEWSKLLIEKALYPGAVCLFFGGTRTFHHLGLGLEEGGFEIVDTLMWLYGAGFPKSHDISKGIDKAAGAEREVTGTRTSAYGREDHSSKGKRGRARLMSGDKREVELKNKPATDEAEQWDGYGTALKPAWEPVYLCRAPRQGKTFAELATEFGSGALNIDGGRIDSGGYDERTYGKGWKQDKAGVKVYEGDFDREGRHVSESAASGRWPANLMFSHHEDCLKVGEFEIEGRTINRWQEEMKPFGGGAGEEYESEQMPPETVERWACVPECAVRILDDQAGELRSGGDPARRRSDKTRYTYGEFKGQQEGLEIRRGPNAGNPSRFFYCGKASRSEKDKGLENFYWKRVDAGFELVSQEEWKNLGKKQRAIGCIHPTVKPLANLRYLATLILPPPLENRRRLLVPFSGSGSEIIAARQAGWDEVVGIEMESHYVKIAEARIAANLGMFS